MTRETCKKNRNKKVKADKGGKKDGSTHGCSCYTDIDRHACNNGQGKIGGWKA